MSDQIPAPIPPAAPGTEKYEKLAQRLCDTEAGYLNSRAMKEPLGTHYVMALAALDFFEEQRKSEADTPQQRNTVSNRVAALNRAEALITGDRDQDHGEASESFARIAQIWGSILGVELSPERAAMCLAGLKLSRLSNNPANIDSWIDLIGYAALGAELANNDKEKQ